VNSRVSRVLAVLGLVVVAILVLLRVLRVAKILTVAGLIGAIVVVGWLLMPTLAIPRFTAEGPVVRNGVAAVVACGKKRDFMALDAAPEPATGTWWPVREGDCTVWYHRPPDATQRFNRHQRAANLSVSGEMLQTERVRRSQYEVQKLPVVEKLER
jgi:hypothetical protein